MSKPFHIIAFDVPYPPNYGGIVDVFYKLKHLHSQGGKIIYHCFYYSGHNPPNELLEKYCDKIYYYERKKQITKLIFSPLPYVVATRNNQELLDNLSKDNFPILFDGLQCCYFLNHKKLEGRRKIIRANNIEHKYYAGLAKWEKSSLKKTYLKREAKKLEKFENQLKGVESILSVAKMDIPHFSKYAKTYHVPPFFNEKEAEFIEKSTNIERFCLFQGNLSVTENIEAVEFIINEIAPKVDVEIKIAGKNPSKELASKINQLKNVVLISNPSQSEMENLIATAHINLLFTFQQTGIKLKLLHALESGKHIIINSFMDDSGIFKSMCDVCDDPKTICNKINDLIGSEFTTEMFKKRFNVFSRYYNNSNNADFILDLINNPLH
jgi:hypothetical protein